MLYYNIDKEKYLRDICCSWRDTYLRIEEDRKNGDGKWHDRMRYFDYWT